VGSVARVETCGLVDGPGIRYVVFLNGCKLRCKFCHNPEMFSIKENNMEVDKLVNNILRYKPYFKNNGGVTFSGGEPLLQTSFILECAKKLKENNINIVLDTAGVGNDYDELLDYIDLVIMDIKGITALQYKEMTSYDIDDSLLFIKKCQEKHIKMWIRQVIVPGINDTEEYINELKFFISSLSNIEKVELLPYHTMALNKYEELSIPYSLEDTKAMDKIRCQELEQILNQK